MDKTQVELVKLFVNNQPMKKAVFSVIMDSFMAKKPNEDIHAKAGRYIALELLGEALTELDRLESRRDTEPVVRSQIGL